MITDQLLKLLISPQSQRTTVRYVLASSTEEVRKAHYRKYHRDFYHKNKAKYGPRDRKRKRDKYRSDEEYRKARVEDSRNRRANMTAEQKKADQDRRKRKLLAMSEAEYKKFCAKRAVIMRRYRANKVKKAKRAASGLVSSTI